MAPILQGKRRDATRSVPLPDLDTATSEKPGEVIIISSPENLRKSYPLMRKSSRDNASLFRSLFREISANSDSEDEVKVSAEILERLSPTSPIVSRRSLADDDDDDEQMEGDASEDEEDALKILDSLIGISNLDGITHGPEVMPRESPPGGQDDLNHSADADAEVASLLDSMLISTKTSAKAKSKSPSPGISRKSSTESSSSSVDNSSESGALPSTSTPRLDAKGQVNLKFVEELIPFFKREQRLPMLTVHKIVADATNLFAKEATLVDVDLGRDDVLNICGDVHGQFFDLAHIFELRGLPSRSNRFLFNGDFVDRGPWGLEVMLTLFSLKLLNPEAIYLNRGNHECEDVNRYYGFQAEVLDKYDQRTFRLVQAAFDWLPLAHCVNGAVLVMHGGLFGKDGVTLEDIRAIPRGAQPERDTLMCDLLWSDPQVSLFKLV